MIWDVYTWTLIVSNGCWFTRNFCYSYIHSIATQCDKRILCSGLPLFLPPSHFVFNKNRFIINIKRKCVLLVCMGSYPCKVLAPKKQSKILKMRFNEKYKDDGQCMTCKYYFLACWLLSLCSQQEQSYQHSLCFLHQTFTATKEWK